MSVMVQVRNVPEPIHRELKGRAVAAGMSLSDYLLRELRQIAERPSPEELLARMRSRRPVALRTPAADILREEREQRGRPSLRRGR